MTRIAGSTVVPEGAPYRLIVEDLAAAPATAALKLADKADIPAEDPDGLNIEGLAATADGAVLVGFRNPQPGGKALVARLANPSAIVLPAAGGERADRAKIDALFPLDLGGRGIRSIDYSPSAKRYLIAAGPYANDGDFALYAWNGGKDAPVKLDVTLPDGFKAEALAELAPGRWLVLSDDGTDECKDGPAANRAFRALVLTAQ